MHLKFALRSLVKRPYVTVIGVLSLAFGIGATTAIFSLYYQLLRRPLPVSRPADLANLSAPGPKAGGESCGTGGECEYVFSYPMFRDLERAQTSLEGIAGHVSFTANLAANRVTRSGQGMLVTGRYFEILGLRPALGRLLGPEDDRAPGESTAVVLSYDYWEAQFAGNPGVLNQIVTVNGRPLTIVGIAPKGFAGTTTGVKPQVFVPITLRVQMQPGSATVRIFENRQQHWIYLFARLKPGVSRETARVALSGSFQRILTEVEAPAITGFNAKTLQAFKARQLLLEDGRSGQSVIHQNAFAPLNLLLAVAALVLLTVCTNLANLLLVEAAGRSGELAIRASIGASRRHLVMQLLTESCVLAMLGGIGALAVARWTLDVVLGIFPESVEYIDYGAQPTVLVFAIGVTIVTGIAIGLFPALKATRPELLSSLKAQTARASGARETSRFRTGLATVQIALSMILLISAGLFAKSLLNLSRVELGLNTEKVVVFRVSPALNGYTTERTHAFFERLETELKTLPGVTAVAAARVLVLNGDNWGNDVSVEGAEEGPNANHDSMYNLISAEYFSTLGMRFKAGRDFTPADKLETPKVAIVNEEFARKFNLGPNPMGKRIKQGRGNGPFDIEIVGLVQNAKYGSVKQSIPPVFFMPYRQNAGISTINFYVRSALDPRTVTASIPAVVARIDPNIPIENMITLERQVRETTAIDRMLGILSSAFALLATFIAAMGLYGVLAYTVSQRTREIGVRMAVGARPAQIRTMILRQVGKMILVGGVVGIAGAWGLGHVVQSLLFQLRGDDPTTMIAAAVFLTCVILAAGFIPAYRASRLHPMEALRHE